MCLSLVSRMSQGDTSGWHPCHCHFTGFAHFQSSASNLRLKPFWNIIFAAVKIWGVLICILYRSSGAEAFISTLPKDPSLFLKPPPGTGWSSPKEKIVIFLINTDSSKEKRNCHFPYQYNACKISPVMTACHFSYQYRLSQGKKKCNFSLPIQILPRKKIVIFFFTNTDSTKGKKPIIFLTNTDCLEEDFHDCGVTFADWCLTMEG